MESLTQRQIKQQQKKVFATFYGGNRYVYEQENRNFPMEGKRDDTR